MPLPKSLRRPVRRAPSASAAGTSRRKCRTCNNLDPRGHANSIEDAEALKEPRTSLNLVLDALALSNVRVATSGGCRYCIVLVQALDAFFSEWRGNRTRVNVSIKEKGAIKVSLDGAQWANQMVEIYAGSGRHYAFPSQSYPYIPRTLTPSLGYHLECQVNGWMQRTHIRKVLTLASFSHTMADPWSSTSYSS